MDNFDLVGVLVRPARDLLQSATGLLPEPVNGIVQILIGIGLIFASVYFMGKLLKRWMVGRAKDILYTALGRGPMAGILAGMFITILVQSSSATTSLMIPLAGSACEAASENKRVGFMYIIGVFFVIPLIFLGLSMLS